MSEPTSNKKQLSVAQARERLWIGGNLSWKLKSNQKEIYNLFHQTNHKTQTWLLSRRSGKTFTLCLLSIEECIKRPNTIIKFVSPTKIQVNNNLRPIMTQLLSDCPEEIRPEFRVKDYIYFFKNGSEIQLAGSESGHYNKLRGGSSHIAIIDEAQDVTDLDDIVKSVLLPTTLTTKGKVLLAGTPPKNADHEFVRYIEEAETRGSLVKKTIYDNPMISKEDIEILKTELGGENSESFRREAMCHIIKDSNYSVIPEFTLELEKEIVKTWERPPFYDTYEAMDLGFKDLTVVLFAYFDFRKDKIVIEDEIAVTGTELQLPKLISDIRQREETLWTNPLTNEVTKPHVRVSDINYIVTSEINRCSGGEINFVPARKDDKQAAINQLRVLLDNQKIIINPKCTTLIRHLRNVKWDKSNKSKFSRSPDDGHYDAVDALLYLTRHVSFNKNPYPYGYNLDIKNMHIGVESPLYSTNTNNQVNIYKKIFKIKGRK